jgi:tRNA(Arg) A34 adenosine deaminase TadA
MMAIMLGQKALKTYDFSLKGRYQIVTSGKMCIMCLGGVIWSGISEVVASVNPEDVISITGFDEGPVPQ